MRLTMKPLILCLALATGCATAQQSGTIAADGLLATSRAVRAVSGGLPASARTPTVIADFQHVATALQVAAALVPVSCASSAPAALQAAQQAVTDAFAAILRDVAGGTPHAAAVTRARTVDDLRRIGIAIVDAQLRKADPELMAGVPPLQTVDALKTYLARAVARMQQRPHTAALSTTDALAIAAAVVGGLSALIPGGIAIYNAVHAVPGPDACASAAKALQEDVATLPAALGGL